MHTETDSNTEQMFENVNTGRSCGQGRSELENRKKVHQGWRNEVERTEAVATATDAQRQI
jgi:hypothetical protein